jgi:Ca-activated chloride channel family protein
MIRGLVPLCCLALAAQESTFKVDVKLVRLLATVKNDAGVPVSGLNKEHFQIFDNGVKQEISLFERHTSQPLSVGILLDISASTAKDMKYQTDSVQRFITALFGEGNPEDRAALYTFNWQVNRAVDYTRNASGFGRAMRGLRGEAGTSLYDAIYLAAQDIADRDGRHVLIVVTDGGDTVSAKDFHAAMQAAHAADAVLYPIVTIPIRNDAGRNTGGENALTTMSRTTGGRLFAPGIEGLDLVFSEILRELRTQYLIGYYPKNVPPTKERFHRIDVKMTQPGLRVVSRTGYYGDSESRN